MAVQDQGGQLESPFEMSLLYEDLYGHDVSCMIEVWSGCFTVHRQAFRLAKSRAQSHLRDRCEVIDSVFNTRMSLTNPTLHLGSYSRLHSGI
jgi:hypothetical protein